MHEKLRISYIAPDFDENAHSGGLYVIFQHCNRLQGRGHTVRIFNNTGKKSRYLKLDCDVRLHKNDPSIIEEGLPHIVIGTHWRTYFFISKMKRVLENNTKLCQLVQSNDAFTVAGEEKPLVSLSYAGKYRNVAPIHKMAVSAYLQKMLKEGYGEDSIYLKNGFEPRKAGPLLGKADKIRIVARYDPSEYRGWDLTSRVLKRISEERDDIEIHLFEMKKKKPANFISVFHQGLIGDSLLSLFRSCDIYLSSSISEGFSYPALEAMSQGCAICSTDAGGNKEFCVDGSTSLLSAPGDEKGLHDNLIKLVMDNQLRAKLRSNGLEKVKEFNWEETINRLEDFFISISKETYTGRLVSMPPERKVAAQRPGKLLFFYPKDPFCDYKDWVLVDTAIRRFMDEGFLADAFILVDRHSARSVKSRLDMLVEPEYRNIFRPIIIYNKKVKINLSSLNVFIFSTYICLRIIVNGLLRKKNKYTVLVFDEKENFALRALGKFFRINLYTISTFLKFSLTNKPLSLK